MGAGLSVYCCYYFRYDALLIEKEELERVLEEVQCEMAEGGDGLQERQDLMTLRELVRKLEVSEAYY